MTLHLLPGVGRRKWPAQGLMPPRTEKERRDYERHYYDVPDLPTQPAARKTLSDVDQRLAQARQYEQRHVLRYEPHTDGRPGGRITPIPAQPAYTAGYTDSGWDLSRAWHEIGHYVVARALGLTVDSIDIVQEGRAGGQCVMPDLHRAPLADQIAVLRAGIVAGRMAGYPFHSGGVGGDFVEIDRLLTAAGITLADEYNDLTARANRCAEKIIRENWAEAERLVAELIAKRKISFGKPAVQVRRISMPLQTRAAAVTSNGDTIQICWGSGEMVKRSSYDGTYLEDLPPENADLSWLNTGKCPLLDSHNNSRVGDVLGVVQANSAFVKNGKGYASIQLGSNASVNDSIKTGTLRNISIGYAINSMKRNGESDNGTPIMTVTSYRILECSIVGVPADKNAEILRKYPAEVSG